MSFRINLKQGEILELTNIDTNKITKFQSQKGIPMKCDDCAFIFIDDICNIINCNGNFREDKTFIKFIKVE